MPSRSLALLRTLGLPADTSRLERSLFELREDVDSALQAFLAKNQLLKRPLPERAPTALDRGTATRDDAPSMGPTTFDPASTYVCLSPSGRASTLEVTPEFWTTIDGRRDLQEGRLVAAFECDADWPHWEMHPHGEEVLILLSGKLEMVLETPRGEERVELLQGRAFVMPRGTWHRAVVEAPGTLLAITYGRGTQHRER
jgi:mannose-6-phosphate isomerase-like protein (cupin superfamily)